MRGVPPVHLEMRLPEPTIERLPGFLRWHRAGALDGGEVFGEYDSTLQLSRPLIAASREVERSAISPEPLPVRRTLGFGRRHRWQRFTIVPRREVEHALEARA